MANAPFDKNAMFICRRALSDLGTRSTITSVFPPDGSNESALCELNYPSVLRQLLRAADWGFATRTAQLILWKALPGTPENPTPATASGWLPSYPAPPWTYSYVYPGDCVRARRLIGQPQQVPIAPPIFSGSAGTNPPISQRLPSARFEIASDIYDASGLIMVGSATQTGVVIVNPGTGYSSGNEVTLAGGTLSTGASYAPQSGRPAVIQIIETTPEGGVSSAVPISPGYYTAAPTSPVGQLSTNGGGTGLTVALTFSIVGQQVILTQQEFALLEYTYWNEGIEPLLDDMFVEAFVAAMAGRLAQPLTGDKTLARDKYTLANEIIINTRVADGNEGLTINDHVPDWLLVRGAGGGLGYEMFFYPLGPLFPVAPLV